MSTRPLAFLGSAALVFGVFFACSNETITLATVPNDEDGGEPIRCVASSDCPTGSFCDRHHCDAPAGHCTFYPTFCPNTESPTCGCDGVTYFNDCLRQAAGISGGTDGECLYAAAACDSNGRGCLAGQSCAQLGGFDNPQCISPGGHCWVLPSKCPDAGGDDFWNECSTAPNALHCQDTCSAIRSGKLFVRAAQCP